MSAQKACNVQCHLWHLPIMSCHLNSIEFWRQDYRMWACNGDVFCYHMLVKRVVLQRSTLQHQMEAGKRRKRTWSSSWKLDEALKRRKADFFTWQVLTRNVRVAFYLQKLHHWPHLSNTCLWVVGNSFRSHWSIGDWSGAVKAADEGACCPVVLKNRLWWILCHDMFCERRRRRTWSSS